METLIRVGWRGLRSVHPTNDNDNGTRIVPRSLSEPWAEHGVGGCSGHNFDVPCNRLAESSHTHNNGPSCTLRVPLVVSLEPHCRPMNALGLSAGS